MKQKRLARLVAVCACFALAGALALTGCASNAQTSSSSTSSSSSSATDAHEPVTLQIFAANSLSKAMAEAQDAYTADHSWVTFADTQYKSSGELNQMLAAGSQADILISASKSKMDDAEKAGYTKADSRFTMFKNDLVMVTSANNSAIDKKLTLDDIATGKYTVAVGDDSVPAGNYANQSLSTVGCFVDPDGKTGSESAGKANGTDAYAGTPLAGKVVTDTSVGNVCKHAESGDVDIAFVYTSDVYRFGGVKVVGTVPNDTHKAITYPAALTSTTQNAEEAQAFLDWCVNDPNAQEIWQKWGFELAGN